MTDRQIERVAVLLTCHNRREKTLECLHSLIKNQLPEYVSLDVFLVDDGSTDKTGDVVREMFPQVTIIPGSGELYWCGGMRLAWSVAFAGSYDYYLWLNDDTKLYSQAIRVLLETAKSCVDHQAIIVGSVCDPDTGARTYGGVEKTRNFLGAFGFRPIIPQKDYPMRCDTTNGNVVLVPSRAALLLGNFSSEFTHGMGDYDYGLRAGKKDINCWITPGYVGTCERNALTGSLRDSSIPIDERLAKLKCPTGLPPAKEWMVFTRRHAGWVWPFYWARTLIRVAFPKLWVRLRSIRLP